MRPPPPYWATLLATLAAATPMAGQTPSDSLATNDSALEAHLQRWDPLLRYVLERCTNQSIVRGKERDQDTFVYKASCNRRTEPSERDDCPTYDVEGSGTVDTPQWATIRRWRLTLRCSG
jgi:hypothetical protein